MATYGGSVQCRDDQVREAKEVLTEQLVETIRALAKEGAFWDVTRILNATTPEDTIVSYKFSIPNEIITSY